MTPNQPDAHNEKQFGPQRMPAPFRKPPERNTNRPMRSYSPLSQGSGAHTHQTRPTETGKAVFVRKNESRNHSRNNKMRAVPKSGMRKVTSEHAVRREHTVPPIAEGVIRVIPLGGVEEVGKNMTAIEYGNEIIIIDAGIQFKTEDTPGIDFILPNTKYVEQHKGKVKALVITHGHLDHIGAIPFIMEYLGNPPIYTREFGAYLIKGRQSEFPHLPPLNIKTVDAKTGFLQISENFKVKFFGVTHSIPDSTGVIIETPFGDIIATGDVRVDNINGVPTEEEFEQYKELKTRNTLLLLLDSTNVEKQGWSMNEGQVTERIDELTKDVPGRIIIATFSSQVERILAFIQTAKKYGKKVVVEGRSMKNNIEIIKQLNLADTAHIIPIEEMQDYPPHKLMVLSTGGQGEEFSALTRIASGTHKFIKLNKTDTIILSSSVVPGNERSVAALKDNLFRHDAHIITSNSENVHSSGHGKRDELEWVRKQIPHKFFMPVHGHHYMLKISAEVSIALGMPKDNIVVPDNGSIVEIYDQGSKIRVLKEKAPSGVVMVDGFSVGDVQEVVIRDRQMLAQDGIFVIIATIDITTGKLRKSPDIIARGFVYLKESQDLLKQTRFIVKKTVEEGAVGNPINFDLLKDTITDNISRYLFQETAKKPMVIPVVIAV